MFPSHVEEKNQIEFLQSQLYINKLNAFISNSLSPDDEDNDDLSPINCKYYEVEDFTKAKFNSSKSFSIFHINIHTISRTY